jgi:Interferon-induced transmembrane protein
MPSGTVKNWLVESIIALLCCEGIFAIPALIYAAQVNGKLAAGDYQGAVEASNNAKKWLIIGLVAAIVIGCGCGGISALMQVVVQNGR